MGLTEGVISALAAAQRAQKPNIADAAKAGKRGMALSFRLMVDAIVRHLEAEGVFPDHLVGGGVRGFEAPGEGHDVVRRPFAGAIDDAFLQADLGGVLAQEGDRVDGDEDTGIAGDELADIARGSGVPQIEQIVAGGADGSGDHPFETLLLVVNVMGFAIEDIIIDPAFDHRIPFGQCGPADFIGTDHVAGLAVHEAEIGLRGLERHHHEDRGSQQQGGQPGDDCHDPGQLFAPPDPEIHVAVQLGFEGLIGHFDAFLKRAISENLACMARLRSAALLRVAIPALAYAMSVARDCIIGVRPVM